MRRKIIPLFLFGLLLYLLWWRFQVSAIRFFDVDEFSYMHWAGEVARGQMPYVDFFSYFTPGFFWAMAPIFWIAGKSAIVFTVGRAVEFVIFLGILGSVGYLFGITRNWKWALLPAVILAFLPMPYDKFLEIRPDNLAVFFGMIGVIGEVRAIQTKKNNWWFISGLFYSASLFVLAKTLPVVGVGGAVALLAAPKKLPYFLSGLFGPWILFFAGAGVMGHFSTVWYSLVRLPFEVYKSAANAGMEADLFFFPNASFYGGNGQGITGGLLVNHALWVLGILFGAYRTLTPFRGGKKETAYVELLLGLIFFASVFGYVKYFPLKHSQYLIPIAVFVAYYAADGLSLFFDWIEKIGGFASVAIVFLGFAYLLFVVTPDVNAQKLYATNTQQLVDLTTLMNTIPSNARVVDLEGRMVFWPEGYPVSSLPVDSTLEFVSRPPASLATYLSAHPADYIWDGDSGRLAQLAVPNLLYIQTHYTPVAGWQNRLWAKR